MAFGDSNIDNGNLFRITEGVAAQPPRWRGRESNGPVVVEYLAENLGVPLEGCVALAGVRQSGTGFRQRLLTPDGIVLPKRKTGRQTTCLHASA